MRTAFHFLFKYPDDSIYLHFRGQPQGRHQHFLHLQAFIDKNGRIKL